MEEKKKQQDKSPKKRKEEKFTERDLRELMDVDKPTYYKKNGAWRSK